MNKKQNQILKRLVVTGNPVQVELTFDLQWREVALTFKNLKIYRRVYLSLEKNHMYIGSTYQQRILINRNRVTKIQDSETPEVFVDFKPLKGPKGLLLFQQFVDDDWQVEVPSPKRDKLPFWEYLRAPLEIAKRFH